MLELLRKVADSVGTVPKDELERAVDDVYSFLIHRVLPHELAEERVLYPVIAEAIGSADATAVMLREHLEVIRLTAELDLLRRDLTVTTRYEDLDKDLRRVLYGLYTLIRVHLANEDEVYLPILDSRLKDNEASDLLDQMEQSLGESATPSRA